MTLYCKGLLLETKDADGGQRVFRFLASSGVEDRQDETVDPNGWQTENFQRNPVFMASHDYSTMPIGKVIGLEKSDAGMVASVVFDEEDPEARLIRSKYERGFLNAVSVGFRSLERTGSRFSKEPLRHTQQELLEISAVAIPANPEALIMRGMGLKTASSRRGAALGIAQKLGTAIADVEARMSEQERAEWLAIEREAETFQKMGRVLSSMNERRLRECAEALAMASAKIFDVLAQVDSNAPAEGPPGEYAGAVRGDDSAETKGQPDEPGNTEIQVDLSAFVAFVGRNVGE